MTTKLSLNDEALTVIAEGLLHIKNNPPSSLRQAVEQANTLRELRGRVSKIHDERLTLSKEMATLENEYSALDGSSETKYHLLPDHEQTAKRPSDLHGVVGFLLGFAFGYFVGAGAEVWGIFRVLLGLAFGLVGVFLGQRSAEESERKQKEQALAKHREKQTAFRKDIFRPKGILIGKAFEKEARDLGDAIEAAGKTIETALKKHEDTCRQAVPEVLHLTKLDCTISADPNDKETAGKPHIKWRAPNMQLAHIDRSASGEDTGRYDDRRLVELTTENNLVVTQSIFVNEGRRLEGEFRDNAILIYSDKFGTEGEFVYQHSAIGQSQNYYMVTEIDYIGFEESTQGLVAVGINKSMVNQYKQITTQQFQSEREKLEEDLEAHAVAERRRLLEAKQNDGTGNLEEYKNKTRSIVEEHVEKKKRKEALEKEIAQAKQRALDEGFSDEEIEEMLLEITEIFEEE